MHTLADTDHITPPAPGMAAIYALCEPTTGAVRYIGQSVRVKDRYYSHLHLDKRRATVPAKWVWVDSLISQGARPILRIIDWVPAEEAYTAEQWYIAQARQAGCPLFNLTDGGAGSVGLKPTDAWREGHAADMRRLFEKEPARFSKLHESMRGPKTENHLQAIRDSIRASPVFLASRARGEENGLSKVTATQVREMRDLYALGGVTTASLADRYGITKSTAAKIVGRRAWAHLA